MVENGLIGDAMKLQTIEQISAMLKDMPERKARTVIEFLGYLRWSDESFTDEEKEIILQGTKEIEDGLGVNWRDVRSDV
jgi:hypothetical protein